jgi:hypothetical protein
MICESSEHGANILMGDAEYCAIRIKRMKPDNILPEEACKIFQDGKGSLIIEYRGKRIVDERLKTSGVKHDV